MGNSTFGYSVVLAEILSLQNRRTASLISFGLDKGVAIQLTSGRAFKIRGKPQPLAGTLSRWTYKFHMVIPDVYELESSTVLQSIYDYISNTSKRKVEISQLTRRGREPLVLTAEGQSTSSEALSLESPNAEKVSCVRCGYDLRAHSPEARCPECGAAVEVTLRRPLLESSHGQWVTSLRRGTLLLCVSCVAIAVLAFLEMQWINQLIARRPVTALFRLQLFNVELAVALPFALGVILFTRKSPGLDVGRDPGIRKLARYSLAIPITSLAIVHYGRFDLLTESMTVAIAAMVVGLLLLLYMRRLWDMVPDTLGRQWTTLAAGLLAGVLTVMLIAYAAFLVLLQIPNAIQAAATRLGVQSSTPQTPPPPDHSLEWIALLPGIVLAVSLAAFWLATSKFRQGGRIKIADLRSMK